MNSQLKLIFGLLVLGVTISACAGVPDTSAGLKTWLDQPFLLLGVMYAGSAASVLKTVSTARRDGSNVTLRSYMAFWPETFSALVAVFVAWGSLLLADQLNFAAAAAYGAIANTSVDLLRSGGRSAALSDKNPPTS